MEEWVQPARAWRESRSEAKTPEVRSSLECSLDHNSAGNQT